MEENNSMFENDLDKLFWKRHNNKYMKIIIDYIKDHKFPSISNLKTIYKMFMTIKIHFKSITPIDFSP